MSLENLYIDYNISIAPQGHKHNRDGWINTKCPHCAGQSSDGYHLGYNLRGNYFSCYHCGGVGVEYTISALLTISKSQAIDLLNRYDVKRGGFFSRKDQSKTVNIYPFKFPNGTTHLNSVHKKYLKSRGFNPDLLEKKYGLMATGPLSYLSDGEKKKIDYRFRIVVPIFWNKKVVSFQTRDYTEKTTLRYIACPKKREIIHHQHILYGKKLPYAPPKRGIIVEGVTDVWRFLGFAFATFGISYTTKQLNIIRKLFDEVDIIYDPEKQAQDQARKLQIDLMTRGVKANNICLEKDPGDLSHSEAGKLLKDLKYI